jgi:hypothetical protein
MRLCGKPHERTMPTASKASRCYELAGAVLTFMMAHPYCFYREAGRHYYNDAFRRLILDLREQYVDLDLDDFATTLQVPLDTLMELLDPGTDVGIATPGELAAAQERSNSSGS